MLNTNDAVVIKFIYSHTEGITVNMSMLFCVELTEVLKHTHR
jgi:hypothetical protein